MMFWLLDLTLLVLGTLRLQRLWITDDLTEPLRYRIEQWSRPRILNVDHVTLTLDAPLYEAPKKTARRVWWADAATCFFCAGFWICVLTVASLYAVGGPGHATELWRWAFAPFALNYVTAHTGSRLD